MERDERIDNLPKWAQRLIARQEVQIRRLKASHLEQLHTIEDYDGVLIVHSSLDTPAARIPRGARVSFPLGDPEMKQAVEVRASTDRKSITVASTFDQLVIRPEVSNVVVVTTDGVLKGG